MPGTMETKFFERADMMDSKIGQQGRTVCAWSLGLVGWFRGDDGGNRRSEP
jgi:hypothetical protein